MSAPLHIGLMTGTSMDAVDAVALDAASVHVVACHSVPLPPELRGELLAVDADTPLAQVMALDARMADVLASAVSELVSTAGLDPTAIRAVGSHGQTVWHAPDAAPPGTLQLGDPNRLAQQTGFTVVADFRRRDIAAGGQGAPLAPAFHQAFFADPAEDRVVVNIGGMANITCLPARSQPDRVTGFDTGPGNALMDDWCRRHRGTAYDADGAWAAGGTVADRLLDELLDAPYFQRTPPKSTGRDAFNLDWLEAFGVAAYDPGDVQATLAELTARTIADGVRASLPGARRILVCGGGARNSHLMGRLRVALPNCSVTATDGAGIPCQWVEAAGFAWLAAATLAGRPGNVPAVTGARTPVPLGGIYRGGVRGPDNEYSPLRK
ncbi:MAG: anhydro-N-acetylmuramic acid kinase [Ectothiorhodospiraceae bacterium]